MWSLPRHTGLAYGRSVESLVQKRSKVPKGSIDWLTQRRLNELAKKSPKPKFERDDSP